jgi:hypothetical protein
MFYYPLILLKIALFNINLKSDAIAKAFGFVVDKILSR